MLSKLILHSPISFNYAKFINFHMNGEKYFQHNNNYLIPFRCKDTNYNGQLIIGNFVYPVSNTLQKLILYKGAHFTYTYVAGDKFTLENRPTSLKCYNVLHEDMNTDDNPTRYKKINLYPNNTYIFDTLLKPNTLLLFPIDKDIIDILHYI